MKSLKPHQSRQVQSLIWRFPWRETERHQLGAVNHPAPSRGNQLSEVVDVITFYTTVPRSQIRASVLDRSFRSPLTGLWVRAQPLRCLCAWSRGGQRPGEPPERRAREKDRAEKSVFCFAVITVFPSGRRCKEPMVPLFPLLTATVIPC